MGRIAQTWELIGDSFAILKSDKELLLLPVFSGIFCVLVSVVVLGGGGRGGYLPDSLRRLSKTPPLAPFGSPGEIPSNPPALGTGSVSSSGFEIGGMIVGAKRVEVVGRRRGGLCPLAAPRLGTPIGGGGTGVSHASFGSASVKTSGMTRQTPSNAASNE